jgi:hypothetical protein
MRGPVGIALLFPVLGPCAAAQDTAQVRFSGYAEVYYSYDFARPSSGERPAFLYNHKRHNEVSANLLLLRAELKRESVRGAAGLMAGTYPQYNLAAEPSALRSIYEAQVGVRLSAKGEVWADAGIFPSHIGFESAIGMEGYNLTRSVVAENSPYYEAGAKLSARPWRRLLVSALYLNGWQRIQREPGNQQPAFGTQVRYDHGAGLVVNWSTFMGSMGPDSLGARRWYSNLYAQLEGDHAAVVLGLDAGVQEGRGLLAAAGGRYPYWFTVVGAARQRVVGRWWLNARAEFFLDERYVVLPYDFSSLAGASLGIDWRISDRVWWRVEQRVLASPDEAFRDARGRPATMNMALTTALCMRL